MRDVLKYLGVAALALVAASAVEAREIRYNLFVPANTIEEKQLIAFFEEVAKETGNSITGKIFPGGQLLTGPATLKGLSDGVADVGFAAPAFYPGELPHINVIPDMVSFAVDSMAHMASSNDTVMTACEECRNDFDKQGLIFLGGHTGTSWDLVCTKPINNLDDLKGRKVRTPGGAASRMVESLGLVSVNMNAAEAATALAGGQIDCGVGATSWLADYSWWDSAKYDLDADLGLSAGLGIFVWNKDAWASLTDKEREVFLRLMPKYLALMTQGYIDRETEVREAAQKDHGVTFTKPDQTILDAIAKYRASDIPNIAEGLKKRGVADPDALIAAYQANKEKWVKLLDQKGRDPAAVGDAMYEESFKRYAK
jgi:TRAP-type C4-dicarboxylate transport system substrate-binding protein